MSRGLGKIQRKILQILKDKKEWHDVQSLAYMVFDPKGVECFNILGYNPEHPNNSQLQSIWRSIRLLEKKGFIESRKVPLGIMSRLYDIRGGVSFRKDIRLNV